MNTEKILDVRLIQPGEKHPTIFATFDALEAEGSFILLNDHDPKPLRSQFQNQRSDQFGWDYLEEGPKEWRVRIKKIAAPKSGCCG